MAAEQKPLHIMRVTPEGEDVPAGRQITIEFNRPVVPLGRMERTQQQLPIAIIPTLNCQWRWLNSATLACNLADQDALKPATKYTLTINPGISAEDGATLASPYRQTFITERPDVSYAHIAEWQTPGTPVINLYTTQPVTQDSLQKQLAFTLNTRTYKALVSKKTIPINSSNADEDTKSTEDQSSTGSARDKDPNLGKAWQVTPEHELPADSTLLLQLTPGLVSALGAEKSVSNKPVLTIHTFAEFKFLNLSCITNSGQRVFINQKNPQSPAKLCNPRRQIELNFNAPVLESQIYHNLIFQPPITSDNADTGGHYLIYGHEKNQVYPITLPLLKAAQVYTITTKIRQVGWFTQLWEWLTHLFKQPPLTNLEDQFGRKLSAPINLKFTTDHRLPNFEMVYHNAVVEKSIDNDVPLYVNNLNRISFDYRSLTSAGAQSGLTTQHLPKVPDIQFAIPMGIRQLLHGNSGAVYGKIFTDPEVKKYPNEHKLFAEITPYQIHAKLGHFNSLVWVTDLATGQPVADATVTIYADALSHLSSPTHVLAIATTDAVGSAVLPGLQTLDPALTLLNQYDDDKVRLLVRVDKAQDMAIMPINYEFIVDTWRATDNTSGYISTHNAKKYGHILTWGISAQGIYRVGDTMQYKLYVRNQSNQSLVTPPLSGYTLQIVDPAGKVVNEVKNLQLSEFGAYSGEFAIPKTAPMGWYSFNLILNFSHSSFLQQPNSASPNKLDAAENDAIILSPMRVLVSDFTPAPFKVTNTINGDLFTTGQTMEVTTAAKLHSGGAYGDASARITAILTKRIFSSANRVASGFVFINDIDQPDSQQIYQNIGLLDNKGELQTKFVVPQQKIIYGKLAVESAVQDDRGKYIASHAQADYAGVDRFVGLKTMQWVYNALQPAMVQSIVVDARGNPITGVPVAIQIERQETSVARIKDAGNAYTSNYVSEWKLEHTCQSTSTTLPVACEFTPRTAGTYRATARIKDSKNNVVTTQQSLWVVGNNHVVWNEQNDSYLPIIAEKTTYHVGETARYLIKNPYPGAKALITVERYGVIDSFVQTLASSSALIELPIKPDYLPGFYLSVTVVSPRVAKPLDSGQVDLGKPTFRMGYVPVTVTDPYKQMDVTITTDQPVYRPRDTVTVQLHAKPKFATQNPQPIELAVAVLDESVFALLASGRDGFDPYQGFYNLDSLDMQNYSLLTRLIGRQKFEKKGANPGGDGGIDLGTRDFFKFVSYWNPSITADAQGNASITFKAPDNLTGWRILALAVTPGDRLGLGDANFKVNRPTEVRPVMPNQVNEGDQFKAGFSIMNRSNQARTLTVNVQATGAITATPTPASYQQTVSLAPYQRTTIWMPVQVAQLATTAAINSGAIHFMVHAGDAADTDSMAYDLPVNKLRALESVASYGTTTADSISEPVLFPDSTHTDVSSLNLVVAPSILSNLAGAFSYMRDYPYDCWEQKLTQAVMARHYQQLKTYMPSSFIWQNSQTVAQQTLDLAANYQAPNGGMVFYTAEDQYTDPYLSAYTALAFTWLRQQGYPIPVQVENKLQDYLLNLLRHDAAPAYYDAGMMSSVRAVALAALAESGKITLEDLQRYLPQLKQMDLFGKAHFLQAAAQIKGAEDIMLAISKTILAQANQTSGKFIFTQALDDNYRRMLASPMRDNCAILSALSHLQTTAIGKKLAGDIPFKLASTIIQTRNHRESWGNTQENMFCTNALLDYSHSYESVTPKLQVSARIDQQLLGQAQFNQRQDLPVTFTRALTQHDLGRKTTLEIIRQGEGRLYYTTRLNFAPLQNSISATDAGIQIQREYSVQRQGKWLLLHNPMQIGQGELVRVDIYVSIPAARNFVVAADPVPGGLEPVNRDLATASSVDAKPAKFTAAPGSLWFQHNDWLEYNASRWGFYHQELRNDSVRYYSDYLTAGNYHLSYTAQAIAAGTFTVMPAKAEAMYDPDVFGNSAAARLMVTPMPQG